jgi:hypothetical protein
MEDAVSIYEPETTKTSYSMQNSKRIATSTKLRNDASRKMSHPNERQHYFLNKLFRTVPPKTPTNSFRHNLYYGGGSHDERSNNDESTNASVTIIHNNSFPNRTLQTQQHISMIPIRETETIVEDTLNTSKNLSMNGTSMSLPPTPISMVQRLPSTKQTKNLPEGRKVFMDKLFTVSRIHMNEAATTASRPLHNDIVNNKSSINNKTKGRRRIKPRKVLTTTRITYSLDGDTTTTNSSVGMAEDMDDLSSMSTTKSKSQKPITNITPFSTTFDTLAPTSTILMDLPTREQVLEIQTDQIELSDKNNNNNNNNNEAIATTMRITNLISPNNTLYMYEDNFAFEIAPNESKLFPQQQELPPPILPTINKIKKNKELHKRNRNNNDDNPNQNTLESRVETIENTNVNRLYTSNNVNTTNSTKESSSTTTNRQQWQQYFGKVLDKLTQVQCINTCSDLDLVQCYDMDDIVPSKNKNNSGTDTDHIHRSHSRLVLQSSNSLYTTEDDDDDTCDLGTYVESMLSSMGSSSFFENEIFDEEYTYTTLEDGNDLIARNNIIPIHLHKSLFNIASLVDQDDGTSFSSQNSAWV